MSQQDNFLDELDKGAEKQVALQNGQYKAPPIQLNSVKNQPQEAPQAAPRRSAARTPLTIEMLDSFLESHAMQCRFNDITHKIQYSGIPAEYDGERAQAQAPTVITSMLKAEGIKGASLQTVSEYLDVIASKHHFNPVTELLDSVKWDGSSRITALFDIMRLPDGDELSRILICKWLMQALSLACLNDYKNPFSADGVLTLNGRQGYGKTALARKLGISPQLFKASLALDPKDKDSVLKATSCFIGELGEVETTMKRDIPLLKAFITDSVDEVRPPYGRTTEAHIRRTSYIATCNSPDFLLDTTGNRRFWTIPCEMPFDLAALDRLDVLQLWAEVYEKVKKAPQGFRLTMQEREQLDGRNGGHTALIPAQAEILDILETARQNPERYQWKAVTVTEFAAYYQTALRRYGTSQIGKALKICGFDSKHIKQNGRSAYCMKLPIPDRHFDSVLSEN